MIFEGGFNFTTSCDISFSKSYSNWESQKYDLVLIAGDNYEGNYRLCIAEVEGCLLRVC